jgi:hypothetical protein
MIINIIVAILVLCACISGALLFRYLLFMCIFNWSFKAAKKAGGTDEEAYEFAKKTLK